MNSIKQTYQQFVLETGKILGKREAKNIARIIFEDVFKLYDFQAIDPFIHSDRLSEIKKRLFNNEPIQYILGQADFYGLKFKVTPDVLIPRPETEELIYWFLQTKPPSSFSLLDIGTGSACIPITIKKKLPLSRVYAVEVSSKALKIARENATLNKVAITFIKMDILTDSSWEKLPKVDVIISNPPYIPYQESNLMPQQVKNFEPNLALFVDNENPLIFYNKIAQLALIKLNPNGQLFFECNEFNAKEVFKLLLEKKFKQVELQEDMEGKERMIRAVI